MNAKRLRILTALFTALLINSNAWGSQDQYWHFSVYLDDQKIGYHNFDRIDAAGSTMIVSKAQFDVRFLFFDAYNYRHDNIEQWDGKCLQRINAVTNDNGEQHLLKGEERGNGFFVQTRRKQRVIDDCVRSFAYWDLNALRAERLLNAQTGEYMRVHLRQMGTDTIEVTGEPVTATRYRLEGDQLVIDLWYSPDGRWLGLDSTLESGKRLRYRIP
jgi:hypothetical protein